MNDNTTSRPKAHKIPAAPLDPSVDDGPDDGPAPDNEAADFDFGTADFPEKGPSLKAPFPPGGDLDPISSGSAADLGMTLGLELAELYAPGPVYARGAMWGYDEQRGLWTPIPRPVMQARIAAWEGRQVGEPDPETGRIKRLRVNNVKTPVEILEAVRCVESHHPHLYPRGYFPGVPGLAFADVFLALVGRQLVPMGHSPDNRATHGYPFPCPPMTVALDNAPAFRGYLHSLFEGAQDAQERIALLGQWFGLALLGLSTQYNKALLLHGTPGAGKGTFLLIMQEVFPPGSVTAIQPQQWTHGPSLAELAGARLNAVNEIDPSDLKGAGRFKAVVSGDRIEAERKFRDPFYFHPEAGHVFTANPGELPAVPRAEKAFWDRWACVPFDRRFRDTAEQELGIAERIKAHELPAVVQWLVSSAAVALAANRLATCPSGEAVLTQWGKETCSVMLWLHEQTGPWRGRSVRQDAPTTAAAYDGYREYCGKSGFTPTSITSFTRRIRAAGPDYIAESGVNRLKREWPWLSKPRETDDF